MDNQLLILSTIGDLELTRRLISTELQQAQARIAQLESELEAAKALTAPNTTETLA